MHSSGIFRPISKATLFVAVGCYIMHRTLLWLIRTRTVLLNGLRTGIGKSWLEGFLSPVSGGMCLPKGRIGNFRAEIDGKWVLAQFDRKYHKLWIVLDEEKVARGCQHELVLTVKDNRDNISTFKYNFKW